MKYLLPEELDNFYKEILKLQNMLADAGIPHEIYRRLDGWQIVYPSEKRCKCSVIEHYGSYGHMRDLLEIMGLLTKAEKKHDSVLGWMKAEDVFERIRKDWEKR